MWWQPNLVWFWQAITGSLDGIIDTVSAKHPLALYLATLKVGGVSVMLGVPDEPMELPTFNIIMRKRCCPALLTYGCTALHMHRTGSTCFVSGSGLHLGWSEQYFEGVTSPGSSHVVFCIKEHVFKYPALVRCVHADLVMVVFVSYCS